MKKMFQTIKRSGGTVLLMVAAALFTLGYSPVKANNIRILGKPQVVKDTATLNADIFFDIAWDNSWYLSAPNNYDAAWIFVKCYNSTESEWHHAYLDDTLGHYSIGSYVAPGPDGRGGYIYDKNFNAPGTDPIDSTIYKQVARPQGSGYRVPHFGMSSSGEAQHDAPMVLEPYHSEAKYMWGKLDGEVDEFGNELDPWAYYCVGFFLHRDTGAIFKGCFGDSVGPQYVKEDKYYGAGDVIIPAIQLRWNYGRQGFTNEDDLGIKVFAIEMVFIPEGPFWLGGIGDMKRQPGSFTRGGSEFGEPFYVTGEDPISISETDPDGLWAWDDIMKLRAIEPGDDIAEDFPKGFAAFYIMRYELTQQAWCEFLNCLKTKQQNTRVDCEITSTAIGSWTCARYKPLGDDSRRCQTLAPARNWVKVRDQPEDFVFGCDADNDYIYDEMDTIDYNGWEEEYGYYYKETVWDGVKTYGYRGSWGMDRNRDGQDIAMNMVSFYDLLAYAEFACLRPMTELEYEKACRGPKYPKKNEFAWGDSHFKYFCQAFNTPNGVAPASALTPEMFANGNSAYCFGKTLNLGNEKVSGLYNCGLTKGMYYSKISGSNYVSVNIPAPLRVGCFADTSTTSRHHSGASYWGVMNLSDNVAEMVISAHSPRVRAGQATGEIDGELPGFTCTHGTGELTPEGEAQARGWGGSQIIKQKNKAQKYYMTRGAIFIPNETGNDGAYYEQQAYSKTANMLGVHDYPRQYKQKLDGPNSGQRPNSAYVGDFYPIEAGMVSSRARWDHDVDLDVRNYLNFETKLTTSLAFTGDTKKGNTLQPNYKVYPCMQGIRCVRTAVDEVPQDPLTAPRGNNGMDWWR